MSIRTASFLSSRPARAKWPYGFVRASPTDSFLGKLKGVLASLPRQIGGFALEEVELSAEITAEGEVAFLGTGGKLHRRT